MASNTVTMDHLETDRLVQQLAAGFEALQDEYQKLFGQHQGLERKLATAREQYNELARLCGSAETSTPPLSLSSSPKTQQQDGQTSVDTADLLAKRPDASSTGAAQTVRSAVTALRALHDKRSRSTEGVTIWNGPSADRTERASSMMPSISESPLEQDFTVEGKPSRLGCPFASMANKKLSSHAASVLSRYNSRDSAAGVPSTPLSSVSIVNGKESFRRRSTSRRASIADPIKAEICGLSTHQDNEENPVAMEHVPERLEAEKLDGTEAGVCPIRFMDQHSPEEVATYFEKHKHELPRSHEVCVRRYQSNEQQIQQLDAKYGNLVSMIQGLGARHKDMLPEEPAEAAADPEAALQEAKSTEKVRRWASSVSAEDADPAAESHVKDEEDRQPHFERPLRDIRVGESPSRPWGIQVPASYLEEGRSETSSKPAQVVSSPPPVDGHHVPELQHRDAIRSTAPAATCPFGFDKQRAPDEQAAQPQPVASQQPAPAASTAAPKSASSGKLVEEKKTPYMIFNGPVFFGYNATDAARLMREAGLDRS